MELIKKPFSKEEGLNYNHCGCDISLPGGGCNYDDDGGCGCDD